jgi:CO/xanthine dehydrogenase FAD-binding subunit
MPPEPPVVSPASLDEAYALLAEAPHRPMAGATDLLVQLAAEVSPVPERVLDLWRIDALRGIEVRDGHLELGALSTYTAIRRSAACQLHVPALVEAAATIGAAQIQHRGTLGGNVMNASPAGDTLPVLLALDATVVAGGVTGERELPAGGLWTAYRETALRPDELLLRIRIPVVPGREQRFRKVGTRRAQAISKVVMAIAWRADGDGSAARPRWHDVRIALGSVAPTPVRVGAAEAVLEGAVVDHAAIGAAVEALRDALRPIDDVRSTAAYRREVSARILRRLLEDAMTDAGGLEANP